MSLYYDSFKRQSSSDRRTEHHARVPGRSCSNHSARKQRLERWAADRALEARSLSESRPEGKQRVSVHGAGQGRPLRSEREIVCETVAQKP